MAAATLWTNASFAPAVASIRVDGDLSTVAGERMCFSVAAVSSCGASVTAARGFTATFLVGGVEVDVSEGGDGRGLHSFRLQLILSSSIHRVTQLKS